MGRTEQPASRPFVVAAIVVGWLALGLALDEGAGIGRQRLIGAATWLLLIVLVRREPRAIQAQVATLVVLATLLEYSASPLLGLYTYRLHNVPSFVPPGHGLVYLAAVLVGRSPAVTRRAWIPLLTLAVATAWAVGGLVLPEQPDTLGFVLYLSFAALHPARPRAWRVRRRVRAHRRPRAVRDAPRHVGLGPARPDRAPERCQSAERDSGRIRLAGLLRTGVGAVRPGRSPAHTGRAQTCSSGAIVRPKSPS